MTEKDKQLLLKDLGNRLAYHPVIYGKEGISTNEGILTSVTTSGVLINTKGGSTHYYFIEEIKPYLRPLGSMTKEEERELSKKYVWDINCGQIEIRYHSEGYWDDNIECPTSEYLNLFDWLNARHFDYRGLIEMGLALEAPEGMYK